MTTLLILGTTTDKLQIVTTTTADLDVHTSYADVEDGTTNVTVDRKNTKINTAATTDVVLAPASGFSRNVKQLHVGNVHVSASNVVTVQFNENGTLYTLESTTLLAGERLGIVEGVGIRVFDAAGLQKVNPTTIAGDLQVKVLAADVANTTTTAAKITGLDTPVGAGTWLFEYFIPYTTVITTTGIKIGVNHTGTVTRFLYDAYGVDTSATAATGAMDQDALATTGQVLAAWAARAKSTSAPMITAGVDTNALEMFLMITGLMVVTVSGNLELYSASEVGTSSTSIKAGTALRLTKLG